MYDRFSYVWSHITYVHVYVHTYIRSSRKEKKTSNKSASVEMSEAVSIQGSPTELTPGTAKPFDGATHTKPALQYDYARTGPVTVRVLISIYLP